MSKTKRTMAERAAEGREALEKLSESVAKISTSDEWFAWIQRMSRFHSYSALNRVFLMEQWEDRQMNDPTLPNMTHPASFTAWKSVDRAVRKGEKGLAVFIPLTVPRKEDEPAPEGDDKRILIGFGVSRRVFDVSQTDGEPFESPFAPQLLTGDADEGMWAVLEAFARSIGFTVVITAHLGNPSANGECVHTSKTIRVHAHRPRMQQIKTLAHELGHACLHGEDRHAMSQATREVEAETVAYLLCNLFGVSSDGYSVGYVGSWSNGDPKAVLKVADRVIKAYSQITDFVMSQNEVPEP